MVMLGRVKIRFDPVTIIAGSNNIHVNGAATDLCFKVTEQIQRAYDFTDGEIDTRVEISVGYELLLFYNTSVEILKRCLKTSS